MNSITNTAEWLALQDHYSVIVKQHMRDMFAKQANRFTDFSIHTNGMIFDYSRNRINNETITLLLQLLKPANIAQKREALFNGAKINSTELRPALHTALRDSNPNLLEIDGDNIAATIQAVNQKMQGFVERIQQGQWLGVTGKPIKHIVNLGIGGSYLGPFMATTALKDYATSQLQCHFLSTIDPCAVHDLLENIDAESCLFIISSKSFTTIETLTNTHTVISWLKQQLGHHAELMQKHLIAITAATETAFAFGIPQENIFPLWDWVGGRYSLWSAIGLPVRLMIGNDQFNEFLKGGYEVDQHFLHAPFAENIPILMALLGIWYHNFFSAHAHAIIPYSHRLRYLIPYLQQADMESNGKRVTHAGNEVDYMTGPIIFGEEGCNGQHTYHQLLHQGQHLIPVDLILFNKPIKAEQQVTHDILLASALSQAQAFMSGQNHTAPHRAIPGNKPCNILLMEKLTPKSLGSLIALYEHKIFVQGAIWDINSYDQWGVELGKQLLPSFLKEIEKNRKNPTSDLIHLIDFTTST